MQDLGTLGGDESFPEAVSADGTVVVGIANIDASDTFHAFRWTEAGGMEDLGTLGGDFSFATAISADGSIVAGRAQNGSGSFRAYRWTAAQGMQDLGTLGGSFSRAEGISADGSTVIGQSRTAAGNDHAFRWGGDSDGDGLLDCWETDGMDVDGDSNVDLDLPAMGARVDRKDIFVEVDAMVDRAPTLAELQGVIDAFDQAPVPAPASGGSGGVTLHIMIDETNIRRVPYPAAFTDFDVTKAAHYGTVAERDSDNWANIKAARDKAFRYCIFADTYEGSDSSGLAEQPGNDFMVTLGNWPTVGGTADQKAGTFMHELGHTLGLDHGGGDGVHYKANYYSVMNYRWQTPHTNYASLWRLDYSREELPSLDETALDESTSLGATLPEYRSVQVPFTTQADTWKWADFKAGSTVDWDGDGMTPPMQPPVAADINRENPTIPAGTLSTLAGFNDWANLRYPLSGHPNFGDGRTATTIDDEFDLLEFASNEQIPPPPSRCRADLDGDGELTIFDFLEFQNLFDTGDPQADFDGDGELTLFDFLAFQNAFDAGCP
ncbi:MAG: GC-type dockerin domain-anchored protein [Phycisphaerales bacterium]